MCKIILPRLSMVMGCKPVISHMLMMYGFLGLFATTNAVMILHYLKEFGFDVQSTPLPFLHPVKILGNVSAIAAFLGIYFIVRDRIKNSSRGTYIFILGKPDTYGFTA